MSSDPNPKSKDAFSLHVRITIAPENVPAFLEALKPVYDAVIAEPACTFFEVYQSPEEPGLFKFVEHWNATKEWMMTVQLQKEYYKPYFAITEPMFIKPREFEAWNRMSSNEWHYVEEAKA